MKNEQKICELIKKLKERNNKAYIFFEILLEELKDENRSPQAIKKLNSSFAITQYGDFTNEEERLLSEIIEDSLHEE